MMKTKGILVVVSGFSGAGKGTLMKQLLKEHENYCLSVSMTTRSPRKGEEDGKDYFFVTKESFEQNIEENRLLEYASYCGNYYGTPLEFVEKKLEEGNDVILEIEIQGARQIKERFPEAMLIFVMAPSVEELKKRLTGRNTETEEVINRRLTQACDEIQGIDEYEYILINEDIELSTEKMHTLIQSAKAAPLRNKLFLEETRASLEKLVKGED